MLLSLLALALVDSINPSAIAVTLYLLSRGRVPAQVVAYVAAIFLTYLALGAMMMLGIDALLPSLRTAGGGRLEFLVQGLIGLAMLIYAFRAPTTAASGSRVEPGASTYAALALLGLTVTAMELPTAVPYFGAISILTAADLPIARWLPLLVLYNAIFVLPPVLLLVAHVVFREADGCAVRRPPRAIADRCPRHDALDRRSRGRRAALLERRGVHRPVRALSAQKTTMPPAAALADRER